MTSGIALLGGVFDPPHLGHRSLAAAALAALTVDQVSFLISRQPPHKSHPGVASPQDRLAMLELTIAGEPKMAIDDRELRRTGPSYTVDTLEEITREQPGRTLYFLVGGDNIASIGQWYQAERIFALCQVVAMPRPGGPDRFTPDLVPFLDPDQIAALNRRVLPAPTVPQSSTEIRERVARGESLDGHVTTAVARYIAEHGLYRPAPDERT